MMIQSASKDEPRFVSTMEEHMGLCGQFVRAFGNDSFERPEPFEEMVYVVSHHDRGWKEWDDNPQFDAKSGCPAGLGTGPVQGSVETSKISPDFNERQHSYCGLISSMHSWGLYNSRYGFSEFKVRREGGATSIPIRDDEASEAHAMLDAELVRQERLKATLAADAATRSWIEDKHLFQNYKQLQFFDTLALYFNLRHEGDRGEEVFVHVPKSADEDATVTLKPLGSGTYALEPFPFAGDRLDVTCHGRYLIPLAAGKGPDDFAEALRTLPTANQVHNLVAG